MRRQGSSSTIDSKQLRFGRGGWCLALGTMLLLGACARPSLPLLQNDRAGAPQWPEAPMQAKVQWVKSVSTARDAGITASFWNQVRDIFTGAQPDNIVKPHGVLFDDAGRLFVADSGLGVVHLMDTKKGVYARISAPHGAPFLSPIGLAQDERGGLFITDSASDTVYRYDLAGGEVTPFFREVARPTGIAYNRVNKLIYIAETGMGRVLAVDGAGAQKLTIDASKAGDGFFNRPVDLAIDHSGQLYVNDPLNYKINVFSSDGRLVARFGEMGDALGEMNKPKGIAVDAQGQVYVCDALLDTVQLFDETGQYLFSFGANGTGAGYFWMPSGIFIHKNYAFVSDTYNNRVQVFRLLSGAESDDQDAQPK